MGAPDNHLYEFEPFLLDAGSRVLLKGGATVRLTPKAFETLLVLVQNRVQVVEKDRLLKEVWPDSFVEEGSLSRNIHELRKALGDDSSEPRFIETIPKRGYRFVAPVRVRAVDTGQGDLTGVQGNATVIEKHMFARVVSEGFEETDLPGQTASMSPVAEVKALKSARGTEQRNKRTRQAALLAGALLLAGAIGGFVYLKLSVQTPAPVVRAKSTLVRLTNNNAIDGLPTWSPDGRKIAFHSNRDGKSDIYVMETDGSNVKRLTDNLADDAVPRWSPDGSKIVFESNRDGNNEIYVMNADGSNQTRLTNDPANDNYPNWSPDGRILFNSTRDGREGIYVMDDDGSRVTRLTKLEARHPTLSPDGNRMTFISPSLERINGQLPRQIFVVDADGGNQTMLTNNPTNASEPCWSPEGAKIAFVRSVDKMAARVNVFQMDSNGRNLRRLTAGPTQDRRPSISPDGSKLAFQSNRDGNYEIYVMNLR